MKEMKMKTTVRILDVFLKQDYVCLKNFSGSQTKRFTVIVGGSQNSERRNANEKLRIFILEFVLSFFRN